MKLVSPELTQAQVVPPENSIIILWRGKWSSPSLPYFIIYHFIRTKKNLLMAENWWWSCVRRRGKKCEENLFALRNSFGALYSAFINGILHSYPEPINSPRAEKKTRSVATYRPNMKKNLPFDSFFYRFTSFSFFPEYFHQSCPKSSWRCRKKCASGFYVVNLCARSGSLLLFPHFTATPSDCPAGAEKWIEKKLEN